MASRKPDKYAPPVGFDPIDVWPEAKPLNELDETDWYSLNEAEKKSGFKPGTGRE